MTCVKPLTCEDLLKFNWVNFDPLTETYGLSFYMNYMARWPELCQKVENLSGVIVGYRKTEGVGEDWHGHVTALSVMPKYRRCGLAALLMNTLEKASEDVNAYFVDLFVRVSNKVAISMYNKLGYSVYRTVIGYYSGDPDEDAYDMRKALPRDVHKKSIIPLNHPVFPDDID